MLKNMGFHLSLIHILLDGSERVDQILKMSMPWDVMVGVARRGWAGNPNSLSTIAEYNKLYEGQDHITLPYLADDSICLLYTSFHSPDRTKKLLYLLSLPHSQHRILLLHRFCM